MLVENKWYKSATDETNKSLSFIRLDGGYINVNHYGVWSESSSIKGTGYETEPERYVEASFEDVKKVVLESAKKKYEGVKAKCLHGCSVFLGDFSEVELDFDKSYTLRFEYEKGVGCLFDPYKGWAKPLIESSGLINTEEEVKKTTSLEGCLPKQVFYYMKSSHGDNFYKILEKVQVKNEFHDWRTYVKYQQLGTLLVFYKPEDMFYKECVKVEV